MRVQIFSVLYFSLTVQTLDNPNTEYDSYSYEEEVATTPKAIGTRRPTKKRPRDPVFSVKEFLDTNDTIWVYSSTEEGNITCRVDVMEDVNPLYANITRYTLSNGEISIFSAKAEFSYNPNLATTADDYNEMKLESSGNNNPFETLIHMSEDKACGVFYVNYHSDVHLHEVVQIPREEKTHALGEIASQAMCMCEA
uniref:Lipocalin n=1 Tax=Rhipicephalus zambeziensis TaxID=60191 RepID=A0A224YEA5_9ACAR